MEYPANDDREKKCQENNSNLNRHIRAQPGRYRRTHFRMWMLILGSE